MILGLKDEAIEADLVAGRISCGCGGRLGPFGHARPRPIRQRDASHVRLQPRRGRCGTCKATQVILPACALPRRRDATEVVGTALYLAARGHGHRSVAATLALPPSTVRNWLRRARRHAEQLYAIGVRNAHDFDANLGPMTVRPSPLTNAVEALGVMARAIVRRVGPLGVSPWCLIAVMSGGLVTPRVASG